MWPVIAITENLTLPTYLVVNSLVFTLGTVWIYWRAGKRGMNQSIALDATLGLMIGAFTGSRLVHVIFEQPQFYFAHPDFIFRFWNGGFVFYGGALGAALCVYLICKVRHKSFLEYTDLIAPVLAAGYSVGRIGCLAAGCCFGKPCSLPWAVRYPPGVEAPEGVPVHPTPIYSSLWEAVVLLVLLRFERASQAGPGKVFGLWLCLHGLGRGIIEQFRDDFRGPAVFNLSISTWFSFLAIVIGVALLGRKNAPTSI